MIYTSLEAELDSINLVRHRCDIHTTTLNIENFIEDQKLSKLSSDRLELGRLLQFLQSRVDSELSYFQDPHKSNNNMPSLDTIKGDMLDDNGFNINNSASLGVLVQEEDAGTRANNLLNTFLYNLPQSYDLSTLQNINYGSFKTDQSTVSRSGRGATGSTGASASVPSDNTIKQLQRDIQRDQLLINGVLLIGADTGLDGAVIQLKNTIQQLLYECQLPIEQYDNSINNIDYYTILSIACRTNSGGISYSALQSLLTAQKVPSSTTTNTTNIITTTTTTAGESTNKAHLSAASNDNKDTGDDESILTHYLIVPASQLAPPICIRLSVDQSAPTSTSAAQNSNTAANKYTFLSYFTRLYSTSTTNQRSYCIRVDIQSTTVFDLKPLHDNTTSTNTNNNTTTNNNGNSGNNSTTNSRLTTTTTAAQDRSSTKSRIESDNLIQITYINTITIPLYTSSPSLHTPQQLSSEYDTATTTTNNNNNSNKVSVGTGRVELTRYRS